MLLAVMDAKQWSYADALHAYEHMPEEMWREMLIRIEKQGEAADDRRREDEAMSRVNRNRSKRGK
jgi:hypothetical protein